MKKLNLFLGILLFAGTALAQVPQSIKYQAIARDADENILSNKNIGLRISIIFGSTSSVSVYSEIHDIRTSPFGLINLEIGNGKVESGDFSAIDWSKGNYYVNIEIDENGGNDFVSMGSSQLLSVPYALYAETSGSSSSTKEANSWTEATGVTYLTNPNNVGIGTTVPVSKLHVTGSGINAVYERNISTAAGPANRFYKSRGSASSKTQVQAGDNLGQFQFWGMGDDGTYDIGATLKGVAESTRTGTDIFDVAGSIQFLTTNNAFSWGERMRITADGYVGIGTSAPAGILDIAGAYHFPSVDGTNGQVLQTNGSGTLNWATVGGGGGAAEINDLTDGKTGGNSVFLGSGAGNIDDGTDNRNVGVGNDALVSNNSGYYNTAAGYNSLYHNTSGHANTAYGFSSGWVNSTGNFNTAIGYNSLFNGSTGSYNTGIGYGANYYNQTGSNNTIIGYEAGKGSSYHSKSGNVFLGFQAGYNETGSNKLYIENSSSSSPLIYGDFSSNLVKINGTLNINNAYQFPTIDGTNGQVIKTNGSGVLSWTSVSFVSDIDDLTDGRTDATSVFLGSGAGSADNGSNYDMGVGIDALHNNIGGFYNTAVGYKTLYLNNGSTSNSAFGYMAMTTNNGGDYCTALGCKSLYYNTTGDNNTSVGSSALFSNTSGNENTAVGSEALSANTTGYNNSAFGAAALRLNSIAHDNTGIGWGALWNNQSGLFNTAVGSSALVYNTSSYNTAVGSLALNNNLSGNNNTAVGYRAGNNNTGAANVFLGYQAGYYETGNNKLYIENSSSSSPLVYGDFNSNIVTINGHLGVDIYPTYKLDLSCGSGGGERIKSTGDSYLLIDKGATSDNSFISLKTNGSDKWVIGTWNTDEDFMIKNWGLHGSTDNTFMIDAASSSIALNSSSVYADDQLGLYPGNDYRTGISVTNNRTTSGAVYGGYFETNNTYSGNSESYGIYMNIQKTGASSSTVQGLHIFVDDDQTGTSSRTVYGTYSSASIASTNGTSYGYGVYGVVSGYPDNGYGVYFSGGLAGSGTKSAMIKTDDGPKEVYCQESPGNWFEDFGDGTINGGQAMVQIPADYLQTVTIDNQHPMKVFISPTSKIGEYWIEKNNNYFILHTPDATDGSTFDFRIVAKRKYYEDIRLRKVPAAYTDHYLYPDINEVPAEYRAEWVKMLPPEDIDQGLMSYLTAEEQKNIHDLINRKKTDNNEVKTKAAKSSTD